ncbi:MAG: nuclear transport factor 2 family protein [Actinobacteria bacterium]|nr:MAG: nuclear transport factor 2 family protein [Actinomycetota bacterium]
MRGQLPGGLDAILHEDCVFLSPVVFTPQKGRDLTKMYLAAAGGTFGGDSEKEAVVADSENDLASGDGGKFHYVKKILQGNQAMLEFEVDVDGKYVNGVDIITCDDDGLITEFKVMIRPLQAINVMHAQMKAMIERLNA